MAQIQWVIMTFPDLAEALPFGFKENRIALLQKSKTLETAVSLSAIDVEHKEWCLMRRCGCE